MAINLRGKELDGAAAGELLKQEILQVYGSWEWFQSMFGLQARNVFENIQELFDSGRKLKADSERAQILVGKICKPLPHSYLWEDELLPTPF